MPFHPSSSSVDVSTLLSSGGTFIWPAVTTGNVPQLSIDLLLTNFPSNLVGNFYSAHVLPCVGKEDDEHEPEKKKKKSSSQSVTLTPTSSHPLMTALQLFHIPALNLLVLQQRTPTILGHATAFVEEIVEFVRSLKVDRMILLTSSQAFRQQEDELDSLMVHPISFFVVDKKPSPSSSSSSSISDLLRNTLHWNSLHYNTLEQDQPPLRLEQLNGAEEEMDELRVGGTSSLSSSSAAIAPVSADGSDIIPLPSSIPVPGLGSTRPLYELCSKAKELKFETIFLHSYVNEGANDREAMEMAAHLYNFLFVTKSSSTSSSASTVDQSSLVNPNELQWKIPSSWSAMFGNEPEESMYL